ncbi:MAG: hypothetical protein ACI9HY_004244, partial [Planctomycetaceae bacterium]
GPMIGFLISWQGMTVTLTVLGGLVAVVCVLSLRPLLRAVRALTVVSAVAVSGS